MKKMLFTVAALMVLSTAAFAQDTIYYISAGAADDSLIAHFEETYTVVRVAQDGDSLTDAISVGADVIWVSETVTSGQVAGDYATSTLPVIVCEPYIMDDMGMTGLTAGGNPNNASTTADADFGTKDGLTVTILSSDPTLSAGLSGEVAVYLDDEGTTGVTTANLRIVWGEPSANATGVAHVGLPNGNADEFAIYTYESGAAMVSGNATARFAGNFVFGAAAPALTADGLALCDGLVLWALGATVETPTPSPTPGPTPTPGPNAVQNWEAYK